MHVLGRLLQEETGKIYCLIRGDDGYDRLSRTFVFYYGNKYELKERVVPVAGDVEQDGLADQHPQNIQTVIHTAASVKHYGPYDYLECKCEGNMECGKLCKIRRSKDDIFLH